MSLVGKFESPYDHDKFYEYVSMFQPEIESPELDTAVFNIKKAVKNYKLKGTFYVVAYQNAGKQETENLAKILPNEIGPGFVGVACNMTAGEMDKCLDAASDLNDYGYHAFHNTSFDGPNPDIKDIGLSFAKWEPISKIGLTAPPSLVTDFVKSTRTNYQNIWSQSDYYR